MVNYRLGTELAVSNLLFYMSVIVATFCSPN
jgi:hypothetical protein